MNTRPDRQGRAVTLMVDVLQGVVISILLHRRKDQHGSGARLLQRR